MFVLTDSAGREIEETVAVLGHPKVAEASFFVAHFNFLCKYIPSFIGTDANIFFIVLDLITINSPRTDRNFFPPCEVAVVDFSLKQGVIRCS